MSGTAGKLWPLIQRPRLRQKRIKEARKLMSATHMEASMLLVNYESTKADETLMLPLKKERRNKPTRPIHISGWWKEPVCWLLQTIEQDLDNPAGYVSSTISKPRQGLVRLRHHPRSSSLKEQNSQQVWNHGRRNAYRKFRMEPGPGTPLATLFNNLECCQDVGNQHA